LKRTSPPLSRRSSTKSTTPPGIASWAATSVHTSPTRPSTSSISTLVKSPFFSSSQDELTPKNCYESRFEPRPLWPTTLPAGKHTCALRQRVLDLPLSSWWSPSNQWKLGTFDTPRQGPR
jgi:hypothetical protein